MYIGRNLLKVFTFLLLITASLVGNAAYVDSKQVDSTAYFLFAAPNKIVRYDLGTQQFLPEITLEKVPTAFAVDDGFAYVGFNRELNKVDFSDNSLTFIRNAGSSITAIAALNDVIYYREQSTRNITVLNAQTYTLLETHSGHYSGNILESSKVQNAIYYRTTGVSPSDIRKLSLSETGTISADADSAYHGDYPSASKLYINTSENKVYDNAGIIYYTADLTYAGSLGGSITDITFIDDNVIALRDNSLTLYNSAGIEQGSAEVTGTPDELFAFDNNVFYFTTTDSDVTVDKTDFSGFSLPELGAAVDPVGLAYVPEIIDSDGSDVIYLYDEESLSIFRWSTSDKKYLTSWTLTTPANWLTVSTTHQRVYLGYSDGKITYFPTNSADATETHFSTLATGVYGLLSAGDHLFAADDSGAWNTHYSIGIDGSTVDSVDWRHTSHTYIWNETNGKIYHYRNGTSPNDIEWTHLDSETGEFGSDGDSPYHGSDLSTSGKLYLINNEQLILNGAGQILDVESLSILNNLSNPVADAIWVNDKLITFSDTYDLQLWSDNYEKEFEFTLQANDGKLLNINDQLNLVLYQPTGPEFLSYDLDNLPDSDNDGKHDLLDNCIDVSNEDQLDNDNDNFGDVCDNDDDNDSLPDTLEISLGLNPKSNEDANSDLDEDGFSNLVESLLGSELDNAESVPTQTSNFLETFNEQWPLGFQTVDGSLPWMLTSNGVNSSGALTSTFFNDGSQSSKVQFTSYFSDGVLSFDYNTTGSYIYRYDFEIYVDGERQATPYLSSSSSEWRNTSISLTAGVHTIELGIKLDYMYGNETKSTVTIDNFTFAADSDNDGISDLTDNCPNVSNKWQDDYDGDGLGDNCDNDPYDQDTDGDGWGDVRDNCPDIANPNQENIDDDYYGDACDDSDDRPQDTDNDGIYDHYDNCLDTANPDQLDFDYDWVGDACDSDIDNDGINNELEDIYSFMSNFDSSDVDADYDNDGVANGFEISSGFSPETSNNYTKINLLEYYPLIDAEFLYLGNHNYQKITLSSQQETNFYRIATNDNQSRTLKKLDTGIYLTQSEYYDNSYVYNNLMIFPASLALGEVSEVTYSVADTVEELASSHYQYQMKHQLVAIGTTTWQGNNYDSITIKTSHFDDGYEYSSESVTYLKGIGPLTIENMMLDSYTTSEVVDNSDTPQEATDDNVEASTDEASAGSGSILSLCLMLALIFVRRRA